MTLILYGKEDKLGHHRTERPIWQVLPGHDTKIMSVERNTWDLSLIKMADSSLWNECIKPMLLANSWISTVSVLLGIILLSFIEARRILAKYSTLFAPRKLDLSPVFVAFISKWVKDLYSMTLCWQCYVERWWQALPGMRFAISSWWCSSNCFVSPSIFCSFSWEKKNKQTNPGNSEVSETDPWAL